MPPATRPGSGARAGRCASSLGAAERVRASLRSSRPREAPSGSSVVQQRLGGALPVRQSDVGLLRRVERGPQVVTELLVLDQAGDVRVSKRPPGRCYRTGAPLRGLLLLRCHGSPRIDLARRVIPGAHTAGTERWQLLGFAAAVGGLRALSARHFATPESAACARRAPTRAAISSTWSICRPSELDVLLERIGDSSKSGRSVSARHVLNAEALSGDAFSRRPPIGRTRPVSVISPVIAVSRGRVDP